MWKKSIQVTKRYSMRALLTLILFLPSCLMAQYCHTDHRFSNSPYFDLQDLVLVEDIVYGQATDWLGQNVVLDLDIAYPDTLLDPLALKPAIVLFHGGGFKSGDKSQWKADMLGFAQRGFVAYSVNYRLGYDTTSAIDRSRAMYRAQQDAHAALRYIIENAASHQVDTNWLFIGGGSAGAVTSMNLVYGEQSEWNSTIPGIENNLGSLHNNGNTLTHTFSLKGIYNNWGAVSASLIDADEMLPMVSFHGELDTTVEIDSTSDGFLGSRSIHQRLVVNSVCSDLTVKPDGGHGFYPTSLADAFRVERGSCFFRSLFCQNCTTFSSTDKTYPDCAPVISTQEYTSSALSFYPQPVDEILQINGLKGTEMFILYNSAGWIVSSGKLEPQQDWSHLESGLYIMKILTESDILSQKLIKR